MSKQFMIMPALDVLEGRCVRLAGGDRARVTLEGGEPEAAATSARAATVSTRACESDPRIERDLL